jgi:hypothetical protein
MTIDELIQHLRETPDTVDFGTVIAVIDRHYRYTPTAFRNGLGMDMLENAAGENEGSCKVFAFAQRHGLDKQETLACFGKHYRDEVRPHPDGTGHGNIRSFMKHGWAGIAFERPALQPCDKDDQPPAAIR